VLEQDILQFDVTMDYAVGVAVLDGVDQLDENSARLKLIKLAALLDELGELATIRHLHDHD